MHLLNNAVYFAAVVQLAFCGELYIISSPINHQYSEQQNPLKSKDIHNVIQYMMGVSAHKTASWKGMKGLDIFNPPQINLLFDLHIPNGLSFKLNQFKAEFQTENTDLTHSHSAYINQAIIETYESSDIDPLVIDYHMDEMSYNVATKSAIHLSHLPKNIPEMKHRLTKSDSVLLTFSSLMQHLNTNNDADLKFLGEIQIMQDILMEINNNHKLTSETTRGSLSFELSSLISLVEEYGVDSPKVKEAVAVLKYFLPIYVRSISDLYKGNIISELLVTEISANKPRVRLSRSLMQTVQETTTVSNGSAVTPNSTEYAVVFNICLWFMIAFALAVLAASYALWFMEPGQDNIIYRMTNQRIKAD